LTLKTLYEAASKFIIPAIRALVAEKLIVGYGYTQTRASRALGVTQPAVSNYLKGKRGRLGVEALRRDRIVMVGVERIAHCIHKEDLGCVNDTVDRVLSYIKGNKDLLRSLLPREYKPLIEYWTGKR
jgi:predicted transcriptional regulator